MSDVQYSSESYCAICDLYFTSVNDRAEHIANSPNHPRCDTCDRRFLNMNILRNHFTYSRHHHYCASCRISFETAAGLKMHINHASIHSDDSEDEDSCPEFFEGQEDSIGSLRYPDESSEEEEEDENNDDSWEHYDDCDFEDEEDLGDVSSGYTVQISQGDEEQEQEQSSYGIPIEKFTCPICRLPPVTTCSTLCGHLFCATCIHQAYNQRGTCPVCEESGSVNQLRKLYISF